MASTATLKPIYKEGSVITHPTGNVYQRIGGAWKLIRRVDGREIK